MAKKENKEENKPSIIYELPEDIKQAPKEVIDKWLEWKKMDDSNKNDPRRYYTIVNQVGETVTIDMLGFAPVIEKICKKNGVSKKETLQILEIQSVFHKLKTQKGQINRAWKNMLYGSNGVNKSVLDIEKAKIIDLYGKYMKTEEIHKIIGQQWGYNIDIQSLRRFKNENEIIINQKKSDYVLRNRDFRLATETGRIEELSEIYSDLKDKFNINHKVEYSRELRGLIEQVRKEVKGDDIRLTIDGKIDVNATIQATKNITDIARKLPVHSLVIGLVAAKQNLDPTQIIASLASSYYAKFNGFNGLTEDTHQDVIHPSTLIKSYDWGEINRLAVTNGDEQIQQFNPSIEYRDKDLQQKAVKRKNDMLEKVKHFEKLQKEKIMEKMKKA